MESKHLINIAGTICPPETEEVFNKWYNEWHIPQNMKFKGLEGVTRYKLVGYAGEGTVKEYPGYLAIYRFKDFDTFKAWNASPELQVARKDFDQLAKNGVELWWRVQYGSINTWKKTPPMSLINVVGLHSPPEGTAALNQWYSDKHIPDLLKFKEIIGVTRYEFLNAGDLDTKAARPIKVKEYPRFVTIYYYPDLATAQALDAKPERAVPRNEWLDVAKKTGSVRMWRVRYEAIKNFQRD